MGRGRSGVYRTTKGTSGTRRAPTAHWPSRYKHHLSHCCGLCDGHREWQVCPHVPSRVAAVPCLQITRRLGAARRDAPRRTRFVFRSSAPALRTVGPVAKCTDFVLPRDHANKRELLIGWLDFLRGAVLRDISGLSQEDAHRRPEGKLLPLEGSSTTSGGRAPLGRRRPARRPRRAGVGRVLPWSRAVRRTPRRPAPIASAQRGRTLSSANCRPTRRTAAKKALPCAGCSST
jgi:hypothetical protein